MGDASTLVACFLGVCKSTRVAEGDGMGDARLVLVGVGVAEGVVGRFMILSRASFPVAAKKVVKNVRCEPSISKESPSITHHALNFYDRPHVGRIATVTSIALPPPLVIGSIPEGLCCCRNFHDLVGNRLNTQDG